MKLSSVIRWSTSVGFIFGLVFALTVGAGGASAQPVSTPAAPGQEKSPVYPPAAPWEYTTSINTDPRRDMVTVNNPETGEQFIAVCTTDGTQTLIKAFVTNGEDSVSNESPVTFGESIDNGGSSALGATQFVKTEIFDYALECRPGPGSTNGLSNESRSLTVSPQESWILLPGPGGSMGLICSSIPGNGFVFVFVENVAVVEVAYNILNCGAGGLL